VRQPRAHAPPTRGRRPREEVSAVPGQATIGRVRMVNGRLCIVSYGREKKGGGIVIVCACENTV